MANIKSAKKRARQEEVRRQHNSMFRSKARTYVKRVIKAIEAGDQGKAQEAFKEAVPVLDSVANKGIIHKNKAARHKHRLNERIKQMSA